MPATTSNRPSFFQQLQTIKKLLAELDTRSETLKAGLERVNTPEYDNVLNVVEIIHSDVRDAQDTLYAAIREERAARHG